MEIKFTDEQQAVIDARKSNILVSAAAGSGKTAVLVERIIQMMSEGTDIDHFLVVTFTRAAAAQMKEKITAAIQKRLSENPDDLHFQRQETLIHNAQINTIDSFCQYIVKNNFNTIGIDPNFRVGDEGELKLLMEEVMSELLEEEYQNSSDVEDSDFRFCMDFFSQGSNDKSVESYINELFKFSRSMPWPLEWLDERSRDYEITPESFEDTPWVQKCLSVAGSMLAEAGENLAQAEKIAMEPDGPYMYGEQIEDEKDAVYSALACDSYDDLYLKVRAIPFTSLKQCRDKAVNTDKRDYAKGLRDDAKNAVESLIKNYFSNTKEVICRQMQYCDRAVKELCRITAEFYRRFQSQKMEKHMIDFSDMEHFALEILVSNPAVALEYRDYYKEVLIDEYQDSNNVQEMILKAISGEVADVSERFMVGDVKQSIYKFRLARPELFMEKFHSYSKEVTAPDRRIDLHKNFRSRHEVLDITNYIFEKIMGSDLGGVDYDEDALLRYGANYEEPSMDVTPELILVDGSKSDDDDSVHADLPGTDERSFADLSPKEKEAHVIASRIKSLMQENAELKYKDIVILLRSPSGWSDVLKNVLEEYRIPVYVESKTGYFESYEVAALLNFLSIIDNPRQDIPLVSVLKSHMVGFTDEDLARIRIAIDADEELALADSFYIGMRGLIEGHEDLDEGLRARISDFVQTLEELRVKSTYVPVHELLQDILDMTGFETIVSALPYGHQRKANIELLLNNAITFEKSSFKGLFHFVRYIEHMKFIQMDYGEAGTIDENADVVRIMSIHKSKGLEFPVVFVAGLNTKLNFKDSTGNLILDIDYGIGVKYINTNVRIKVNTLKHAAVAEKIKSDCLGEEIRILYVALTRAKEKLIITAYAQTAAQRLMRELIKATQRDPGNKLLPYSVRKGAGSYFDLVLPSVITHPAMKPVFEKLELDIVDYNGLFVADGAPALKISLVGGQDLKMEELAGQVREELRLREFAEAEADPAIKAELEGRFTAEYGHLDLKGLYTKTTVTELKKKLLEQEGEFSSQEAPFAKEIPEKPEESKGLTGAERGTAYHRIMELLDDKIYGNKELMQSDNESLSAALLTWIKEKTEAGIIPEEYLDAVKPSDVAVFLKTDLGQRMGEAFRRGELYREKPFMMGVSATELNKDFPEDEMVLVQGIVDAWFLENGEIILMDYKTDRVGTDKELVDRYKIQLDYYKKALEAATKRPVRETFIYSFCLGREISIL